MKEAPADLGLACLKEGRSQGPVTQLVISRLPGCQHQALVLWRRLVPGLMQKEVPWIEFSPDGETPHLASRVRDSLHSAES